MKADKFRHTVYQSVLAAAFALIISPTVPQIPIPFCVNLACLVYILHVATQMLEKQVEGFDPVVAAETLVAFGIACLVGGLVTILFVFLTGNMDVAGIKDGNLLAFLPFAEGLLTAGIAPLFAIFLRLKMAEQEAFVDATGDMVGLANATASLTKSLKEAGKAIEAMQTQTTNASTATAGLASTMKTEADNWGLALHEGQAYIKTFAESTRVGAGEVSELARATSALKASTSDVTKLLDELARLVVAVERFVEPRAAKS